MSKKISELVDELESQYLEGVEIEEAERLEELSFTRIKALAIKPLDESEIEQQNTPKPLDELQYQRKKKISPAKTLRKMLIPLVAALALVGASAMAIKSNDTLSELFGEAFPFIQSELQEVSKSITAHGITFTAESAAIENKAGLFVLSFTKEDGTRFEEGAVARELFPRVQKRGGMGWSKQTKLVEDGKQLVYIVDLSADKNLYGQPITYTAKDIGVWRENQVVVPVDLYSAYQHTMAQNYHTESETWETYDTDQGVNVRLIQECEDYQLDRVAFKDQTLELITSAWVPNGEELLEIMDMQLIDTRTGKVIENKGGHSIWSPSDQVQRHQNSFEGVKVEDLPYLHIQLAYRYFDIQAKGQWEVAFELDKNKNLKEKKLIKNITTENTGVILHDLELSKLGLKLEGLRYKGPLGYLNGYLQMKDGTKIELLPSGMGSKWHTVFVSHYKRGEVLTEEEVQARNYGSASSSGESQTDNQEGSGFSITEVKSEVSVQTKGSEYEFGEDQLIDLENVEAVLLEGVSIPIK